MMSKNRRQVQDRGRSAAELIEEACALLRAAPLGALLCYFIGAVPFWLTLLYFISDMSRSADAEERLGGAALGVALAYLWMKCWQTAFASRLHAVLLDAPDSPWKASRIMRAALCQIAAHPLGIWVRLLALVVTIPFGWVSAFYQNMTILGDGMNSESTTRRAIAQAKLWPVQSHRAIFELSVLGLFIWLNILVALIAVPVLLKSLLGIETIFTRSILAYLNTTFFTATFALTFLCLDPIWKAVYVLRCFYGESLRTGQDLAVQLRRARRPHLALLFLGMFFFTPPAHAASPAPAAGSVPPGELDQRIEQVLAQREYRWRMPREKAEQKSGWLDGWLADAGKTLKRWGINVRQKITQLIRWISEKLLGNAGLPNGGRNGGAARLALWAALGISIAVVGWILWRQWRLKKQPLITAQAIESVPDLSSEDVAADQLPEDGWMELSRACAARGELTLALRAAWLACLAHLGQRDLLRIARHKSNREYAHELERRARNRAELLAAFRENLRTFEAAWYGQHGVTDTSFAAFTGNLEKIRGC